MNVYYVLDKAVENKEIGPVYPQAQDMVKLYDYEAVNSITNIAYYKGRKIPFEPNFDSIKLMSSAKLTDVISVSMLAGSGGLLISERLKKLLEEYRIINNKIYPVKIIHKNILIDNYFYLHLIYDLSDFVDYEKSKFYARVSNYVNNNNLFFKDKEEVVEFYNKIDLHKTLRSEYIVWSSDAKIDYDLFCISNFDQNIYVSKKLYNTFLERNITGIKLSLATSIKDS